MENIIGDTNLVIIYIVWILLFILGIRFIFKYKLWKPMNYLTILIIVFMYIILLYQIRVYFICSAPLNKIEKYANLNQTFKLSDRNKLMTQFGGGSAPTKFNWDNPLRWAENKNQNFYADDNNQDKRKNGPSCFDNNIRELTELAVVSLQQLQDANAAYANLVSIQTDLRNGKLNENNALTKLIAEIKKASSTLEPNTIPIPVGK